MLNHLAIRDYATVDSLDMDFSPGLTAITGETGAGKSIILGALGLTLGDRADKTVLRKGADKTSISAEFDLANIPDAQAWLRDMDLEDGENGEAHCLLRRVVTGEGRSRAYINGVGVTLANLRTLGEKLMDIHSQHEHQSLMHRATHQRLLDDFAVEAKLATQLASTWRQWQQNHQRLQALQEESSARDAEAQLLRYQLEELQSLGLEDDEVTRLESESQTLDQAEALIASLQSALTLCSDSDEGSALAILHQAHAELGRIKSPPPQLQGVMELLETARIQVDEAMGELRAFGDAFEADPRRLQDINDRLGVLHELARKHKVRAAELPELMQDLEQRLARFADSEADLEQLEANDRLLREQYMKLAQDVSAQRKKGAGKFARAVNEQLEALGMPHARLEVSLSEQDDDRPHEQGLERIEFLVSTNPGQDAGKIQKIASGGELSRISLAIQVIAARSSRVPSLVFDEVDVGIGGGTARVVGELLRKIGEQSQVLCVTHQAQVAGQAHQHLLVHKALVSEKKGRKSSQTRIETLSGEQVVREVARMLGGDEFSAESLAHAEQLVVNT